MRLTSLADWNCSIAKTLDVVGEWWRGRTDLRDSILESVDVNTLTAILTGEAPPHRP